ncbi:MAG: hypothetical protein ACHQ3O_13690 [Candidatus Limnocylindria bacterium]
MLAGHYSAAFLAKALAPGLPLWILAIAVQLIDVLWAGFVIAGIEHLRVDPSLASNPLDLYDMPYTHSLLGALGWAALAGAAVFAWRREGLASLLVAGAVASHWLLDWIVHRPDLLLWSGSAKHGLALWNLPVVAIGVESLLLIASAWWLLRGPRGGQGLRRGVVAITASLLAVQVVLRALPPPIGPRAVAASALVLFGAVAWGAWRSERRRVP